MRSISLILFGILLLFCSAIAAHAEELNAGFVQGLWYGTKTVTAGEPTRIYVALRNNTENDLTGTVRFTDNGSRIGVAYVSALPGRIVEAWVDWTPRYGEHTIAASLSNVQIYAIGEVPATGDVGNTIAESTLFVDHDTDNDGIPNAKDLDDDNDGISDDEEELQGTNPLKAEAKKEASNDTTQSAGASDDRPNPTEEKVTSNESGPPQGGLESYIPNPRVRNTVSALTDTIVETRASLDAYREKREDAIQKYFEQPSSTPESVDGTPTITRSHTQGDESFFESVLKGGKALVSGFYSFILWVASKILSKPAIVELVLLLGLIYFVYRTARRFGRRRN